MTKMHEFWSAALSTSLTLATFPNNSATLVDCLHIFNMLYFSTWLNLFKYDTKIYTYQIIINDCMTEVFAKTEIPYTSVKINEAKIIMISVK